MKAIWKDETLAESNNTKVVENNHYFPPEDVKKNFFNLPTLIRNALGREKLLIATLKLGMN